MTSRIPGPISTTNRHGRMNIENYAALLRETGRSAEADKLEARAKAIRARHAKENK